LSFLRPIRLLLPVERRFSRRCFRRRQTCRLPFLWPCRLILFVFRQNPVRRMNLRRGAPWHRFRLLLRFLCLQNSGLCLFLLKKLPGEPPMSNPNRRYFPTTMNRRDVRRSLAPHQSRLPVLRQTARYQKRHPLALGVVGGRLLSFYVSPWRAPARSPLCD
jgi:hypothetical protein